jgi:hypothetical protein
MHKLLSSIALTVLPLGLLFAQQPEGGGRFVADTTQLETVVVKPLIRREGDRIIFDVSRDPDAKRMKMSEIMKKIPELTTDPANGNLVYENQGMSQILFDNQEEGLISASRQYPMDFIKATVMEQIELILPGSAEYDNDKPIINIKLAHDLPNGIAWELSADANNRGDYGPGIDAVSKIDEIGIGVNYNAGLSKSPELQTNMERTNLENGNLTVNDETRWSGGNRHNLGVNVFRNFLDRKMRVNFSTNTSFAKNNSYANSNSITTDSDGTILDSYASSSRSRSTTQPRFNFRGSLGHTISPSNSYQVVYGYSNSASDGWSHTQTTSPAEATYRRSESASGTTQQVVNATYMYRHEDGRRQMFYAKMDYINRDYRNSTEYSFYDDLLGDYVADIGRSDGLNYRQNIVSGRFAYIDRFFDRKMDIKADLNVENVNNKGTFTGTNTPLDYNQINFFPSFKVGFDNRKFNVDLDYRTRVQRPGMDQLNPYVDDSNPNYISVGNPELRGEYSHSASLSLGKSLGSFMDKKFLSNIDAIYRYGFTNNAITRIASIRPDNVMVNTWDNLAKETTQSITLRMGLRPADWFSVSPYVSYNYDKFMLPDGSVNRSRYFSGSANALIIVKQTNWFNVYYSISTFNSAQSRKNTYYSSLNASFSHYFEKIHVGGSISCSDVLHGNRKYREMTGDKTFIQYADRQRIGRTFNLHIYWRFGRFKDPEKPTDIELDVYDMGE